MCLLAPMAAWCQGLSDPTRPPAGLDTVAISGKSAGAGGGLVLQSVLIAPDIRSAIISGELVQIGEKIGGQRLVRVSETEVVLLEGGVRHTLKLFPGLEKRATSTRSRP